MERNHKCLGVSWYVNDESLFHINHTTLRFGIKEFAIITGLKCFGNKDDFLFDTRKPNRLINQYFEGKSIVTKVDLISKYKKRFGVAMMMLLLNSLFCILFVRSYIPARRRAHQFQGYILI